MHRNDLYDSFETVSFDSSVVFVHAASYLIKLLIDYLSFGGCGQACPGMPKEAFKTLISRKLIEV